MRWWGGGTWLIGQWAHGSFAGAYQAIVKANGTGKNIRRKSLHAFDFTSYFSRVNRHFFVAASSPMRAVSPRLTACGLATLLGFAPSLRVPCHSCCSISTTTLGLGPEPSPTSGLVLPAALFSDLLQQRTVTAEAFQGVPMQNFDGNSRSKVINGLVRTIDENLHPGEAVVDATATDFDWFRSGRRVACKTAQLRWDRSNALWSCCFSGIKIARKGVREETAFDELLLALYTPRGIYIYRHDLKFGLSRNGRATASSGHTVHVYGRKGQDEWQVALGETILPKFDASSCKRIAVVPFDEPSFALALNAVSMSRTATEFTLAPLADLSSKARGDLISLMVRRIDQRVHPEAMIEDAVAGIGADGKSRSQHQAEYSWRRNGLRVACKSSQLAWDSSSRYWVLCFNSVKLARESIRAAAAFDELLLALYTPRGIYVYRHDLQLGVSKSGKNTATAGHSIKLYGPRGVGDWRVALDETILPKLDDDSDCERLAFIGWPWGW